MLHYFPLWLIGAGAPRQVIVGALSYLCCLLYSDREGPVLLSRSCCHVSLGLSTNQTVRACDVTPVGYGARGGGYGKISHVSSRSAPQG